MENFRRWLISFLVIVAVGYFWYGTDWADKRKMDEAAGLGNTRAKIVTAAHPMSPRVEWFFSQDLYW